MDADIRSVAYPVRRRACSAQHPSAGRGCSRQWGAIPLMLIASLIAP